MSTYFIADTHFSHKNILKYQPVSRPFENIHEMNKVLTIRWNSVVHKDDTIYHLGDFCFSGKASAQTIFDGLNGNKILIVGNHDNKAIRELGWKEVHRLHEISVGENGKNYRIILCHFAMKVWNKAHHGTLQFYGHSHGSLAGTNQSTD